MTAQALGMLTREQLASMVAAGEIDTVIVAICDMQGRLMGKRLTASYFLEHCQEHGTHFCTYLLGTDMEMNTPEGFTLMNWETGYGDYMARPDWNTLRVIPWLEKTALVLADAVDEESGELVPVAPRTVLRRQVERCLERGLRPLMSTELEFYLLADSYDEAAARGFDGLRRFGWYNEDYHLLQGTKAEPFYRALRNGMSAAGVPIECSKGEAAPGQHEVNIHFADALEAADRAALFKHGAKEIAYQQGRAVTFMAKPDQSWTGSSGHIHVSLWDPDRQHNLFPASPGSREPSDVMRWFLGGLIACTRELALFFAPNVNSYKRFAVASWAPVHLIWGRDNRTCGFRIIGRGDSLRIENRFPGGDANPYLAFAAVLAAGLYGIEQRIEPPPEYRGNGYRATDAPRVPRALYEAIATWEASEVAREAFGLDVVAHYLNAARCEQESFDATVTDWERTRYFERG